jgi:hypothetical protein
VTGRGKGDPAERPDIEIGAAVRAKHLRFHSAPETEVTLHGDERSGSGSERRNLPEEVEPGVDYRDVEVRWGAAAYMNVEEAPEVERER